MNSEGAGQGQIVMGKRLGLQDPKMVGNRKERHRRDKFTIERRARVSGLRDSRDEIDLASSASVGHGLN
jgi:hypothetical protein